MGNQWRGLILLALVAAVAATLGGLLSALRKSTPTSADEARTETERVVDKAPSPLPESTPSADKAEGDSPWSALFGGGSGKSGKGRKAGKRPRRDPKPSFTAEFAIDAETPRIEFVSASEGFPTSGEWRGRPALGDLDQDGNVDVVCSVRKGDGLHVFYGDGAGHWTEKPTEYSERLGYGGSEIADFNSDGFLDIVFSTHGAPAQVLLGDGNGGWTRSNEGFQNPQIIEDVAVADFNGDRHLDVVGIGWAHGGVYMMFGDGTGKWQTVDLFPGDDESFGHEILAGDINKDGHSDFAVTMGGPKIFLGDGNGGFRPGHRSLPVPLTGGTNFGIALGDVTGDGTLELAVSFTAMEGMRGIAVYDQQKDGSWKSISAGLPLETSFGDVELADLDGDGRVDLIGYTEDNLLIWRGNGGKSWIPAGHVPGLGRAGDLVTGDLNGDDANDIIVVHRHGRAGVQALLKR